MNTKPVVHIKEWGVYGYPSGRRLEGVVIDHPNFPAYTKVTSSKILNPTDFSNVHDGAEVETQNTIYVLVGENVNSSD